MENTNKTYLKDVRISSVGHKTKLFTRIRILCCVMGVILGVMVALYFIGQQKGGFTKQDILIVALGVLTAVIVFIITIKHGNRAERKDAQK